MQNYRPIQHFCQTVPIVDDHVREAMGDALYELFTVSVTHPCFSWSRVRLTRYASFILLSKLEAHFCVCVCAWTCAFLNVVCDLSLIQRHCTSR